MTAKNQNLTLWVQPRVFEVQLKHVMSETRLPWRVIALLSGVPEKTLQRLISHRPRLGRIRYCDALSIANLDASRLIKQGRKIIPADHTRKLVNHLLQNGIPQRDLADFLQISNLQVAYLVSKANTVAQRTSWLALAACHAHGLLTEEFGIWADVA